MKSNQDGFSFIIILIFIVVIGAVGAISWLTFSRMQDDNQTTKTTQTSSTEQKSTSSESSEVQYVSWEFNGENWQATGSAPDCSEPYVINSPMDVKLASSVLYPGQIRGGDFKPHGGIGTDGTNGNTIDVTAVKDAYLYRGSRYIEGGVVQYMFDFIDSCGYLYRLDHLAQLTDEFNNYANQLPEPKPDDSRTTKFPPNIFIKQGTLIATQVGNVNTQNAFFDLGLYDLRKNNEASKTDIYKSDSLRISDKELSFYAVCWFDYLPEGDKAIVKSLPARGSEGKTSDYCT